MLSLPSTLCWTLMTRVGNESLKEATAPIQVKLSFTARMRFMVEIGSIFREYYDLVTYSFDKG